MILLGQAHAGARVVLCDLHTFAGQRLDQRQDRGAAAEIDDGAGPVEHHQLQRREILIRHHMPSFFCDP